MKNVFRERPTLGWILLLIPIVIVFYWKILLTGQFSLLTDSEGVNQGYSWLHFWVTSLRQGALPIWDPYGLAGHSFVGEMQTGAFNPLRLLFLLVPFNRNGVIPPSVYHGWYAAMHLMAVCFMFALLREFRLSRFSSFIGGICFGLGGFVGHVYWPDMYESAAWLPIVFLFLMRALRAETIRSAAFQAALSGLAVGMSILASRLHIVMMEMLVVFSASVYYAIASRTRPQDASDRACRDGARAPEHGSARGGLEVGAETVIKTSNAARALPWRKAAAAFAVVAVLGAASGAVQLLPSIEYSPTAYRLLGAPGFLAANTKIPYAAMQDQLFPNAISSLAIPFAYGGNASQGEAPMPYLGLFPLIAAIIGIRRYWGDSWVRYLAGLAVVSFVYCLGSFSPLHGALYATVPKLWMLREASRIVYLFDFALAILAAFGIEALISAGGEKASWPGLDRVLMWCAVACGVVLFVPAVWTKPEIGLNPWNALSILIFLASYSLLRYMESGHRGPAARVLITALVLFDLNAFDWGPRNKADAARQGGDQFERALSARGVADFLKSKPRPFRIKVQADNPPNIGDLYRVPMVDPAHPGSLSVAYTWIWTNSDLLNVRYIVTPSSEQKPGAVYQDAHWKVYENPTGFPRAWVAHETRVEASDQRAAELTTSVGFDARRIAVVQKPLALSPAQDGAAEPVVFSRVEPNRLAMRVYAESRGLLVMSEMYYPGWRAKVDGRPAEIYKVDGALRGVIVPAGRSTVEVDYVPFTIYGGGAVSLLTFGGVAGAWLFAFWRRRRSANRETTASAAYAD